MFNHAPGFPITNIEGCSKEFRGKSLSEEVLAFADQPSRCCAKAVKGMEDAASLMGTIKTNTSFLSSSNIVLA